MIIDIAIAITLLIAVWVGYQKGVVQPLLVAPDAPSHTHKLNEIAARLESQCLFGNEFQSCDYAGIYVLRRKP